MKMMIDLLMKTSAGKTIYQQGHDDGWTAADNRIYDDMCANNVWTLLRVGKEAIRNAQQNRDQRDAEDYRN